MDLNHLKLPFLILVAAGCCYCQQGLLPPETRGVRGKSVQIPASIPINYQSGMITWTFSSQDRSLSVYSFLFEKETIGPEYDGRVSYNRTTSTLEIKALKPSDSGTYILQLISTTGQVMGQTSLLVLESVSDVKIASNLSEAVEFNSTVVLTCTAKGSLLTYKWLNGSEVVVADGKHVVQDGSQLTINEVLRTDLRGAIFCVAENELESARSAPFNLTVSYGPDLVSMKPDPVNANLKMGSNLTLSCSAQSNPVAELRLLFNGAELPQMTSEVVFSNLREDQSGNYSCRAFNSKTKRYATSQIFTVSVLEAISGTNINGPATPLIAGNSTCNLTCNSSAGKADRVIWLKDGKPLEITKRIILTTDKSTITISPVEKEDSGLYLCQMQNKVNIDNGNYTMTIYYGPEKVAIEAPKQIEVGHRVVMNCTGLSYPVPDFSWKFNETLLEMANTAQYTIEKPDYTNTGIYTCTATNRMTGNSKKVIHQMVVKGEGELNDQLSNGAIAGIIIAVLLILAVIIGIILHKRRKIRDVPSPY